MAGTLAATRRTTGRGSDLEAAVINLNRVITDLETLRAALAATQTTVNAIITAAATDLPAVAAVTPVTTTGVDTAADLVAARVGDMTGTAIA